jgi:hypothetical protein
VHAAFGTVVFIVCGVAIVFAVVALVTSGRTWSDYGKGGLIMDRDAASPSGTAAAPALGPESAAEREAEIREMLEARNVRRVRRGEPPLDVEAELARLTAPPPASIDPSLEEEVRQLVVARNHRRVRAGKPPLDVDAEVERELRRISDF